MKKWYEFLFYCFYIIDRVVKPQWWSEHKAVVALCAINFYILITIYGFTVLLVGSPILEEEVRENAVKICAVLLIGFNWFLFLTKGKYKKIVSQYDKESEEGKNTWKYGIIVMFLVLTIALFALMLYLTGKKHGNL